MSASVIAGILAIAALVLDVIAYIVYLSLLSKGKKMLAEYSFTVYFVNKCSRRSRFENGGFVLWIDMDLREPAILSAPSSPYPSKASI